MLDQKIIQRIIKLREELCVLLESMHPVEVLKRAYCENIDQCLGKESESQIGRNEINSYYAIEYLQSLFISIDIKETLNPPINEKRWRKIKQKVYQIYDSCSSPFLINQDSQKLSQKEKKLFYKILSSWVGIRGNRYTIHEREHLISLLKPHNEILKRLYNVTTQDISKGIKEIHLTVSRAPVILRESYESKIKFKAFSDKIKSKNLSTEKKEELLRDEINNLKLEEKIYKENLDVEKITNWPIKFIKKFSATPGSNKLFITTGKYPGTPLQLLPIVKKPFLEYDSRFHLFCYYSLNDYFYRNIQSAILEDMPDYSETWNKKQKEVSEQMPFEIFEKIIDPYRKTEVIYKKQKRSKIKQIKNFKYKIESYPKGKCWFECDGIILFEKWLFVIEVKAGKICYQSPAEDIDSHFKTIKKLLTEPAKQGRRLIDVVKHNHSLDIYDSKGKSIIGKISVNDFSQSLVWAVSLEQLTDIASQMQQFKALDLEYQGEPVICISIDDLRTYRDLSNGVIEFFHFLTERKKAFYNPKLTLDDELDHFGMYLKHNQYHDITENFPKAHLNSFIGYRDELDKYLQLSFVDPERKIEKPKQKIPQFLKDILMDLEVKRKPGFVRTGLVFYSLSGEDKDKTNKSFLDFLDLQRKQRRIRPSVFLLNDVSISLIMRIPDIQPNFFPKDYAIKNMFIQEKEECLLLDIFLDEKNKIKDVSFEWIKRENLNEEEVRQYKEKAKQLAEFRFYNQMKYRDKKKVGRNEKCLCGSGKKYKKCHGLRI